MLPHRLGAEAFRRVRAQQFPAQIFRKRIHARRVHNVIQLHTAESEVITGGLTKEQDSDLYNE